MNYTDAKSAMYLHFATFFQANGIAIYDIISTFGPLPTPPKIIISREDIWSRMTMDTIKMPYTQDGYFRLARERACRVMGAFSGLIS